MGVLTEGFDAPETGAIDMARPTRSRGLYTQMIGRGTRPVAGILDGLSTAKLRRHAIAESHKPEVLIIDFVGNSGQHRLVHSARALEPLAEDAVVQKAEQLAAENPQMTMFEAISLAEQLIAEARKREGIAAEHDAVEVDPFMKRPSRAVP